MGLYEKKPNRYRVITSVEHKMEVMKAIENHDRLSLTGLYDKRHYLGDNNRYTNFIVDAENEVSDFFICEFNRSVGDCLEGFEEYDPNFD